jgi:hypothetical protein
MDLDINIIKALINEYKPTSADALRLIVQENLDKFLSNSTIEKFLKKHKLPLFSKYISNVELESNVAHLVERMGGEYGRKTMKGALASIGINASQKRVATCLKTLNPEAHTRRILHTNKALNPMKYRAPHFGYNLHMDQNEKLVDYGCVVVMAIDGHSNFIVGGTPRMFKFRKIIKI